MQETRLRSIAVVGGGVAGWMAAATLSRLLQRSFCRIAVVDLDRPDPLGPAVGTIPAIQRLHNLLGIDEDDFIRRTGATFKLGVEFRDWMRQGSGFFHTFCEFGGAIASVPFHHYWLKLRAMGDETDIADYSVATVAARHGRFARTGSDAKSPLSLFSYAYHLDTDLYADYLRAYAVARGVERIAAREFGTALRSDGLIGSLTLDGGRQLDADFFIDCTGFPGLLMEDVLKAGVIDWSGVLPCDRAISVKVDRGGDLPAHTTATAHHAGWGSSISLQSHKQKDFVYASTFLSDDDAVRALPDSGRDVRSTRFVNGRSKDFWVGNCLALPGSHVGPLEANAIHMIQTAILKLVGTFPDRTFNPADRAEYNRLTIMEHERIRDFLALHYCTAGRVDSEFWRHCRSMPIPETLRHKIELFRGSARVNMLDNEHFAEQSWISVFLGHAIVPRGYDPLADVPPIDDVKRHMSRMVEAIRAAVRTMPAHADYLAAIAGSKTASAA